MEYPEQQVIEILINNQIDLATTLPCDRIKGLLPLVSKNIRTIPLTREENGVGICAGAYLGGGKPVMIIQSTGLGNMINALESLNITYGIPLPILTSWRGVYKEPIEAQWQLGKRLPVILEACGIPYTIIESADEIEKIDTAIKDSFLNLRPHVALMSPAIWEGSSCDQYTPSEIECRQLTLDFTSRICKPEMTRLDSITIIAEFAENENNIVVSNLGIPSKELYDINDRALNFYMLGSMGLASAIGLGLAISQPNHVYVIDGDGSLLMNPNALGAIGAEDMTNLSVIAIDNAAYGSTGNQETATLDQVDLELLAKASGIKYTSKVHTVDELREALMQKTRFIHSIVKPLNRKCKEIPYSAKEIKERFMKEIGKNPVNLS